MSSQVRTRQTGWKLRRQNGRDDGIPLAHTSYHTPHPPPRSDHCSWLLSILFQDCFTMAGATCRLVYTPSCATVQPQSWTAHKLRLSSLAGRAGLQLPSPPSTAPDWALVQLAASVECWLRTVQPPARQPQMMLAIWCPGPGAAQLSTWAASGN